MEIRTDVSVLRDAVSGVKGASGGRSSMPVLSNALLEASGDELVLSATDLDVGVRCRAKAKVAEPGSVTVPARKLSEILSVLPKGEVSLKADAKGRVKLKAGSTEYALPGISAQEFPELPSPPPGEPVLLDPEMFSSMAGKTIPFVAPEGYGGNYGLQGVLFERQGETSFRMVASDGHRLAVAQGEAPGLGGVLGSAKVIVPKKGIAEIENVASRGEGPVGISARDNFLFASKGDMTAWVRLIGAEYPDYRLVIPQESPRTVTAVREEFLDSLRRILVITPESVAVEFAPGEIRMKAVSPEFGEAVESLPAEMSPGGPVRIGFNGKFLRDALSGVEGGQVLLGFKDESSQVVVRETQGDRYVAVVMPLRLTA